MENRQKGAPPEKKLDSPLKDRGDNARRYVDVRVKNQESLGDRGDTEYQKIENQTETFETEKKTNLYKNPIRNYLLTAPKDREKSIKKIYEKMNTVVQPLDYNKRRKLLQMYTFRRNYGNNNDAAKRNLKTNDETVDKKKEDGDSSSEIMAAFKRAASVQDASSDHLSVHQSTGHERNSSPDCDRIDSMDFLPSECAETATECNSTRGKALSTRSTTCDPEITERRPTVTTQKKRVPLNSVPQENARRPVIKTITGGDATKVFKAVSFVDTQKKVIPIKICIPRRLGTPSGTPPSTRPSVVHRACTTRKSDLRCQYTKPRSPYRQRYKRDEAKLNEPHRMRTGRVESPKILKDKTVKDPVLKGVKERNTRKTKNKLKAKGLLSPILIPKAQSPSTEVAKWAPQSITEHTQPYYEAWVNTTLTAICKDTGNRNVYSKKDELMRSLQRILEPEEYLPQHMRDERYTGRIKVTRR